MKKERKVRGINEKGNDEQVEQKEGNKK